MKIFGIVIIREAEYNSTLADNETLKWKIDRLNERLAKIGAHNDGLCETIAKLKKELEEKKPVTAVQNCTPQDAKDAEVMIEEVRKRLEPVSKPTRKTAKKKEQADAGI